MSNGVLGQLIPAAVVIDTRNVAGQARRLLGKEAVPEVSGLKSVLNRYGFDPLAFYAGVATESANPHNDAHLTHMLSINEDYAQRLLADGAHVLRGRLVKREKFVEEKQVDVMLALRIAELADEISRNPQGSPYKAIVVLSEDMDLMPAYDYAGRRGVPVYAAAVKTVHKRFDQRWLLLDERALREICPIGDLNPSFPIRNEQLRFLVGTAPATAPTWRVEGWEETKGLIFLKRPNGVRGILRGSIPKNLQINQQIPLYAQGMDGDMLVSRGFPYLSLVRKKPSAPASSQLIEAHVEFFNDSTRVRVTSSQPIGGTRDVRITVPVAELRQNETVYIFHDTRSDSAEYVAAKNLNSTAVPEQLLVRVTSQTKSGNAYNCIGSYKGRDQKVVVNKNRLDAVRGDCFLVTCIGKEPNYWLGVPMSSTLRAK